MAWKKIRRLLFHRRGESHAISAVILAGVVVALGLATLTWARGLSMEYVRKNSEIVDDDLAKLRERLAVEYIWYDNASDEITIYLMNCGTIDDVSVRSVRVRSLDSSWTELFSSLSLQLDIGEEGNVTLSSVGSLTAGGYYYIRITTERGAMFDSSFVA